jgi:hypothetical protein
MGGMEGAAKRKRATPAAKENREASRLVARFKDSTLPGFIRLLVKHLKELGCSVDVRIGQGEYEVTVYCPDGTTERLKYTAPERDVDGKLIVEWINLDDWINTSDESKEPDDTFEAPSPEAAVTEQPPRMPDDLKQQESVGARLLRELSPEQVALILEDCPLGHVLARYERQLRDIELPEGGFTTKAQADAAGRLDQTFRELQNIQAGLGLPVSEKPERVREAVRRRSAYVKHHTKTGEVIPARPRGRPPRTPEQIRHSAALR